MPRGKMLRKSDLEKSSQGVILPNADKNDPCIHGFREIINPPNPIIQKAKRNLEEFYKLV